MPRQAKAIVDIRSIARTHTESCLRTLASIVSQAKAPHAARVAAANSLLDRGWGKAPQSITGEDGGDIRITIRKIIDTAIEEPKAVEHLDDN